MQSHRSNTDMCKLLQSKREPNSHPVASSRQVTTIQTVRIVIGLVKNVVIAITKH